MQTQWLFWEIDRRAMKRKKKQNKTLDHKNGNTLKKERQIWTSGCAAREQKREAATPALTRSASTRLCPHHSSRGPTHCCIRPWPRMHNFQKAKKFMLTLRSGVCTNMSSSTLPKIMYHPMPSRQAHPHHLLYVQVHCSSGTTYYYLRLFVYCVLSSLYVNWDSVWFLNGP